MKKLDAAIRAWYESGSEDKKEIYSKIKELMNEGSTVIIPVMMGEDILTQYIEDSNNNQWCGVFTSIDEVPNGAERMLASCPLIDIANECYREGDCNGLVFNVYGEHKLFLDRKAMDYLMRFEM